MATSPEQMDNLVQTPAPKAGKPPITANPAFPWIVALWFAALLGVGSLIVPIVLLDRVSTAIGVASILPMAAPPLGFTAKALIALVGALLGGALGLFLAKKIAAPKSARPAARQPLNAAQELGEPGIDADAHDDLPPPAATSRRRALAIKETEGPSDFLRVAPLPSVHDDAEEPLEAADSALADEEPVAETRFDGADSTAPLEAPRQEFQPADEQRRDFQPAPASAEAESDVRPFDLEEGAALTQAQPSTPHDDEELQPERQALISNAEPQAPLVAVEYTEPVTAPATAKEPLPFSPPSMANEDQNEDHGEPEFAAEPTIAPDEATGSESEDTVSDEQIFQAPDAPETETSAMPVEKVKTPAVSEVSEEPDGEGLAKLLQRLGSTLEKHREWSAEQAVQREIAESPAETAEDAAEEQAVAAEAPVPEEFDPALAEDAAQAMANFFGTSATSPATAAEEETPRPRCDSFQGTIAAIGPEEEGDDDEIADIAASFTLPLANTAKPEPMPRPTLDQPPTSPEAPSLAGQATDEDEIDEVEAEDEADDAAGEFASLDAFKRNAGQFVRVEEPEPEGADAEPAVLFPNQEARKPAASTAPASPSFDPPATEGHAPRQRAERPRPSNDDNERALREALMNLQRMGK